MSDTSSWGYDEIMKFINLLRRYPLLWDVDNSQFRNNYQRELAYDEISFAMNTTNECIRKKIHAMRSRYRLEFKRLTSKKYYTPRWKYFNDLKFIYKHENFDFETLDSSDSNKNPLQITDDEESNTQDDDNITKHFPDTRNNSKLCQNTDEVLPQKRNCLSSSFEEDIHSKGRPRHRSRKKFSTAYNIRPNTQDELAIFGEHIATELRLLKGHQSVHNKLKSKIIQAIKEAKYALHNAELNTFNKI